MIIEYLSNNICKFTPLFKVNYSRKRNIVATSLFKMSKGYKNLNIYLEGIKKTNDRIKLKKIDFEFRLFIDKSIYNDNEVLSFLKKEDIKLVLFHCDNYIIDKYHRGTFGTIIRFFPMFDFKNNDSDIVIIIDSDEYGNNLDKLLETINFLKKNDNLEGLCLYFQGSFAKQINKINGNNIAYCMANTLINKEKIKKSIIENYLKNIFTSNHDSKNYYINNEYYKISKLIDDKIYYGFDEIFLNHYLINYLVKNNKKIVFLNEYSIIFNIYFLIKHNLIIDKYHSIYKKFFEYVFKDNKKFKYKNLKESFKLLDELLYSRNMDYKNYNNDQIKYSKRILKFYEKIYKTKYAIHFNSNFLNYIFRENNKNIIYKKELIFVNYKKIKNIVIKKLEFN